MTTNGTIAWIVIVIGMIPITGKVLFSAWRLVRRVAYRVRRADSYSRSGARCGDAGTLRLGTEQWRPPLRAWAGTMPARLVPAGSCCSSGRAVPALNERRDPVKGSQKPKKLQKKAAQKTLKERRVEKKAVAAEQDRADRSRA